MPRTIALSTGLSATVRSAPIEHAFTALRIEGGLLPAEFLHRIAAQDAMGQTPAEYGVPPGRTLREEIGRYWTIAEAMWREYRRDRPRQDLDARRTGVDRWLLRLLRDVLGYADVERTTGPCRIGERTFPVTHRANGGAFPLLLTVADHDLDRAHPLFGDDGRRRAPLAAMQEFLNADPAAMWGLVSNGTTVRLLRDNPSLTRPAYIEADLERIFEEGLYPDFAAFWLIAHASRAVPASGGMSGCWLERWRTEGAKTGQRALERLRDGVATALRELGSGFVEDPLNDQLRASLRAGTLTAEDVHQQLLRLVYRLLFLFTAEERNLLHPPGTPDQARALYRDGYGVARLRERARQRRFHDRHGDLWAGLTVMFKALARGAPPLGLPALGGLFDDGQCPDLDRAILSNRRLLQAVNALAFFSDGDGLQRVNYRDMGTEELGSVYESLLELHPMVQVEAAPWTFGFVGDDVGGSARGSERRLSGSYYTPDSLVQELLRSALDPVIERTLRENPADPRGALLKLRIIDPACGSGHFLLGAARRLADAVARLDMEGDLPDEAIRRHALREVVQHCIYGVDRNPLSVELCKAAMWIETIEPGRPLSFLNAHIRCGDSLIGVFDYDMLRRGIPDEAYAVLTGDDRAVARAWMVHNKAQRDGRAATGFLAHLRPPAEVVDGARAVMAMPEDTLPQIAAKRAAFERLHGGPDWMRMKLACDLYVAAFFLPKTGSVPGLGELARPSMPLTEHVWKSARGEQVYGPLARIADDVSSRVRAFHWPLEFPEVFAGGGFHAVLGNPPWERIKIQEQEFFAVRSPAIANAANKAARDRLIKALETAQPETPEAYLFTEFERAKRAAEAGSVFVRTSGRFPLTGVGDVNTYALFTELFAQSHSAEGRAGLVVPSGIALDSTTSTFFGWLVKEKRLTSLFSFYEIRQWFKGTDDRKSFCLLTMGTGEEHPRFCFDIIELTDIQNAERCFLLSPEQIARINPNTKTAPVFQSRADSALTAKIYDRVPILLPEDGVHKANINYAWGVNFQTMFHMANDSDSFLSQLELERTGWILDGTDWVREDRKGDIERRVPLYEAKMIHHYDHRWATYGEATAEGEEATRDCSQADKRNPNFEPTPRYWVPEDEVSLRAARVPSSLKRAWRDRSEDRCAKALAEWLIGYVTVVEEREPSEEDLTRVLGRRSWRAILGKNPEIWVREQRLTGRGIEYQLETRLTVDDVAFLQAQRRPCTEVAWDMISRKQPTWLIGFRDIALRSVERTMISTILPKKGTNHKIPLLYLNVNTDFHAVFLAMITSLVFDYIVRQKVGGTSMTYFYVKQFPVVPPDYFSRHDLSFLIPRVIELTYTSYELKPWAEDLRHLGPPFTWDEDRRALLRAELDAYFAAKYGLTRDELRYVLDPTDLNGADYPSETFRVLRDKEVARYGEYRTRRLVLDAWDRFTSDGTFSRFRTPG